ncbi:MAG: GreA/GreB family elongation factor [Anaerolineae bacterium]|nr:GreA/GreB family elongation factor [Anaerolineae bacterium]
MAAEKEKFILTPGGYANIKQQLADLETRDKEERDLLTDSRNESLGGDDDDADVAANYETRTRKERIDEKIGHLKYILERAQIYEDPDPDKINTGERVTLWDFENESEFQVDVISSAEVTTRTKANPNVKDASEDSPIGQALLGKGVGDIVEVETPDGKIRYAVRKIDPISTD